MLIGQVLYYRQDGTRMAEMDNDVTAEYAQRGSRMWPDEIVEWSCRNGDRRDVLYFRAGKQIANPFAGRDAAGQSGGPGWRQPR